VLIVDDDSSSLDLVQLELERTCFSGIRAESVMEETKRLADARPEAAIMDLYLPKRPGHEPLGFCSRTRPQLPIALLAGADTVAKALNCMNIGGIRFPRRPFERARLATTLCNSLNLEVLEKPPILATEGMALGLGFSGGPAASHLRDANLRPFSGILLKVTSLFCSQVRMRLK
jgi:DNA-binding NtrC family response regulator